MPRYSRRVVTGHDANGKSVFVSDGPPPNILEKGTGVDFFELWRTYSVPAPVSAQEAEPTLPTIKTSATEGGVNFRFNDLFPGHRQKWAPRADGRHPGMHRTESIDFGIVLEGEIYLILDEDETLLKPGDVVIQRGTDHAWENRTDQVVRMAFILIDGAFTPELRASLPQELEIRA